MRDEPMTARDSVGLEFSVRDGQIYVSYPPAYGAAFAIGPIPESYLTDPPNAITGERVAIWQGLLARDAAL